MIAFLFGVAAGILFTIAAIGLWIAVVAARMDDESAL